MWRLTNAVRCFPSLYLCIIRSFRPVLVRWMQRCIEEYLRGYSVVSMAVRGHVTEAGKPCVLTLVSGESEGKSTQARAWKNSTRHISTIARMATSSVGKSRLILFSPRKSTRNC